MNKKKVILASFIVAFSVLLSSFGLYFHSVVYSPNFLVDQDDRPLIIPTGSTFKDVQRTLFDEQYVSELVSFSFLSKLMGYQEAVKPGLYLLKKGMNNMQVVRMLRAGEQTPVNVTFSNARLLPDLAEKITSNLEMTPGAFLKLLDNDSLLKSNGFDSLTVIGMFIPNTYQMYWNTKPERLFEKMKVEYDKFWDNEKVSKAKEMGLTPKEVSALASIVQEETQMADEQPVVAGLYYNRLRRNQPLMADPTLKYAAQDFEIRRVLNFHKEIDSPYNTYKHLGLPPGPINMPSISSLEAVLNYQKHNYLYMCAKEDFSGYHNFATNLPDHNRNAEKFHRAMNKAGIYR